MLLVDIWDLHKTKLYVNASAEGLDLVVDSPDKQTAIMEICDLQGRRVHTTDLDLQSGRNHVTVPLVVARGIWVVQVRVAGETRVAKVVR